MTRYVYRNGEFRDADGEPMPIPERDGLCMPMVVGDIPAYASPIDGRMITSRSARRYDLESNNCREADPPMKRRGFKNPEFARRHGLTLNEEARDTLGSAR